MDGQVFVLLPWVAAVGALEVCDELSMVRQLETMKAPPRQDSIEWANLDVDIL